MKQSKVTQLDLNDVPQVYHNLKYNDGEIIFADDITSIPGLMKQFQVNFIAYVMVLEGSLSVDLNGTTHQLSRNCSLLVDRKVVVDNVRHTERFRCLICAMSTDMGFAFFNKSLMQSVMHILANPVITMSQDEVDLMLRYYDLLTFKMDHPEMNFGRETVRDIIRCFAYDLLSNINKHLEPGCRGRHAAPGRPHLSPIYAVVGRGHHCEPQRPVLCRRTLRLAQVPDQRVPQAQQFHGQRTHRCFGR